MKFKTLIYTSAISFLFFSCTKENTNQGPVALKSPKLPIVQFDYTKDSVPTNFGKICDFCPVDPSNGFNNGIMSPLSLFGVQNDKVELGRVLFYDKALSINNSISCGSCHKQKLAFSDDVALSTGFGNKQTLRNSFAIVNCINSSNLFWDSRSFSLNDLALKPVLNHIEMGMESLNYLKDKLAALPYYKPLFRKVYGSDNIDEFLISDAIAQFVGAMVSSNSKFDKGRFTDFSNFTNLEKDGHKVFATVGCKNCHAGLNFTQVASFSEYTQQNNTANIGLDNNYKDNGFQNGKFKIPSLRNVGLTAPYMHDGRFKTLEEVVEHYSTGIKTHPDLDKNLKDKTGKPLKLNLNPYEKLALVAFLKTLSDEKLTQDVKYSDPFNN